MVDVEVSFLDVGDTEKQPRVAAIDPPATITRVLYDGYMGSAVGAMQNRSAESVPISGVLPPPSVAGAATPPAANASGAGGRVAEDLGLAGPPTVEALAKRKFLCWWGAESNLTAGNAALGVGPFWYQQQGPPSREFGVGEQKVKVEPSSSTSTTRKSSTTRKRPPPVPVLPGAALLPAANLTQSLIEEWGVLKQPWAAPMAVPTARWGVVPLTPLSLTEMGPGPVFEAEIPRPRAGIVLPKGDDNLCPSGPAQLEILRALREAGLKVYTFGRGGVPPCPSPHPLAELTEPWRWPESREDGNATSLVPLHLLNGSGNASSPTGTAAVSSSAPGEEQDADFVNASGRSSIGGRSIGGSGIFAANGSSLSNFLSSKPNDNELWGPVGFAYALRSVAFLLSLNYDRWLAPSPLEALAQGAAWIAPKLPESHSHRMAWGRELQPPFVYKYDFLQHCAGAEDLAPAPTSGVEFVASATSEQYYSDWLKYSIGLWVNATSKSNYNDTYNCSVAVAQQVVQFAEEAVARRFCSYVPEGHRLADAVPAVMREIVENVGAIGAEGGDDMDMASVEKVKFEPPYIGGAWAGATTESATSVSVSEEDFFRIASRIKGGGEGSNETGEGR